MPGCPKCHGSGYESFWGLVTRDLDPNGGFAHKRIEVLSLDMARRPDIEAKLGPSQDVYEFARACSCYRGGSIREAKLNHQASNPRGKSHA